MVPYGKCKQEFSHGKKNMMIKTLKFLLMFLLCGVQAFFGFGGRYGPNRSDTRIAFRNWAMVMNQLVIDDRIGAMVSKYQATM